MFEEEEFVEETAHAAPPSRPHLQQYSREIIGHWMQDFVLSIDHFVDFMIRKLKIELKEGFRQLWTMMFTQKLRDRLAGSKTHYFMTILSQAEQQGRK
jgi:hypothetical protein